MQCVLFNSNISNKYRQTRSGRFVEISHLLAFKPNFENCKINTHKNTDEQLENTYL